jgi:DNA-binding MarR family transcriptional regulator
VSHDTADHIDEIVGQWRRERPDLDTAPLATLGRLLRVAQLAEPLLATPLRELGLQPGWFDLLAALRRAGTPYELNPTELMRATMLSSGGMTKRLDRLAHAGLVERRPDPHDRRGTLVRLTSKGKATIDRAVGLHIQNEAELLGGLTTTQRRALDQSLRALLAALEHDHPGARAPHGRREARAGT